MPQWQCPVPLLLLKVTFHSITNNIFSMVILRGQDGSLFDAYKRSAYNASKLWLTNDWQLIDHRLTIDKTQLSKVHNSLIILYRMFTVMNWCHFSQFYLPPHPSPNVCHVCLISVDKHDYSKLLNSMSL